MDKYTNELEQFIYQFCFQELWERVTAYITTHPATLDLRYCRVKYPSTAFVEDMVLEFTRNIRTDGDTLSFEAVVSCTVQVEDDESRSAELNQWLLLSCRAVIEDRLKSVDVLSVTNFTPGKYVRAEGTAVTPNIVPIIYKKDLDAEAEAFLRDNFPAALEEPTPVPIAEIAEKMGLEVIQGFRISDDFSIFGEICFSAGTVDTFDIFECEKAKLDVKRGTVIIDAYTYWERNIGCVNNTIAHEVFHWYKHRLYAAVKQLLRKEKLIACRCPVEEVYPDKEDEWTDEQRMEWQANSIAPRILMPLQTFKMKVDELYTQYRYEDSPIKPLVLTCIADDLARFYGVSRQSALIRMIEVGHKEATSVIQFEKESGTHSYISEEDAFHEYSNNEEFRKLVDTGLFTFVDGYFVINDSDYIEVSEDGHRSLTSYAWDNLDSCTLKFTWQTVRKDSQDKHLPGDIFHRENADRKVSRCSKEENEDLIRRAEEVKRKQAEFEREKEAHRLMTPNMTCWEKMWQLIESRGVSKSHFMSMTGLGEEVYRKAEKNIKTKPSLRTIVAFAHGFGLNLTDTERLLQLAGHAFDESDEHQALKFCITGYAGRSIEDCNDFLNSYNYPPLGTQERDN